MTAPTASRPPPATTSARTPRTSTCGRRRCSPGWSRTRSGSTRRPTRRSRRRAARWSSTGWPSSARSPSTQATRVEQKGLGLAVSRTRNGCVSSVAPFFCDYAYRYLLRDPALGKTVDERKTLLKSGGLTIKTTIDLRFQEEARNAVTAHVNPTDQAIGALAMVEPGSGNVRAISQSRPMGRQRKLGQTYLNYVVPKSLGDSGGFQAGSTFKVFVLASALEQGIPPTTAIRAPSQIVLNQGSFPDCDGNYPSTQPYPVGNSTSAPPAPTLYTGTQDSVNTFYVQLEQRTGLCKPYRLARSMGVELTDPDHERVPSFTLGVPSVSPLEMAGAYATFANRGVHCDSKPVTEILNSEGKVFKKYEPACKRVMSKYTADTVNDILRGVMEGGFGSALQIGKPSAGKTGTIQDNKAVWFDGYTPSLATVAMVAGANSQRHADHAELPDRRRRQRRPGLRLDRRGSPLGRLDEGDRTLAARRGLRAARCRPGPGGVAGGAEHDRHDHRAGGVDPVGRRVHARWSAP